MNERQRVVLRAKPRSEIQLVTTSSPNASRIINGSFTLSFRNLDGSLRGTTRALPSHAAGRWVEQALNDDVFDGADAVRVHREVNYDSVYATASAFRWRVTFTAFRGEVPLLEVSRPAGRPMARARRR